MNQRTQIIVASALAKKLYETKNKNKNIRHEIKKMSEDGKETEKPHKILKIVEEVFYFD